MNSPIKVGITGGIGSGKSLICRVFSVFGVPIYDADSRAKWLMVNDPHLVGEIKSTFGDQAYVSGALNRAFLASRVFSNKTEIDKLNKLVHPAVGRDFSNWCSRQQTNYIIKEAALLVETGSYKELDYLVLVTAPEKRRIERVLKRDTQRTESEVENIISNQIKDSEKIQYADFVIENDEKVMVLPQINRIHQILSKK